MSVDLVLASRDDAEVVERALDNYLATLANSIERTRRKLREFEKRYQASTEHFLKHKTADDLQGGDLDYVEWAGEARLLEGFTAEVQVLERVRAASSR